MLFALAACPAFAGEVADEPRLVSARLRIEPTEAQLATLPEFSARWVIADAVARDLESLLRQWQFAPSLAQELVSRLQPGGGGDGAALIVPDAALLDRFTPAERARWHAILGMHTGNRAHRWPLSIPLETLDRLGGTAGFEEAARRVRNWGARAQGRILFGDLFALEDAFASAPQRRDFFRAVLGSDALMVKLGAPDPEPGGFARHAAYWQVNGRYRAIQPFLNAVARVEEEDRIDIAHLLPRLPRATLYTFPPELSASSDPAIENGLLAARFFDHAADDSGLLEGGLSAWLEQECAPAAGPRQYGDIVVFEDRIRTPWPYCGVYIADGIVFGREPVACGAWVFLAMDDVPRMNPRLAATAPVILRRKSTIDRGRAAPREQAAPAPMWVERATFSEAREGPWGRLRFYDVLLAPPGDLLEMLPRPARDPLWRFRGLSREAAREVVEEEEMPEDTRRELIRAFARAEAGPGGELLVRPSRQLVFDTPPAARARLFRHLAHGGSAIDHAQELILPSRAPPAEWFSSDVLEKRLREPVVRLAYPRGRSWMISDYGSLYHAFADPADRATVLRAVFRAPAVVALLEKPRPEEAGSWSRYWNFNYSKDSASLLDSFSRNEVFRHLDIAHLMPPLAREFSNAYLLPSAADPAASCYWTALNFNAERPDSRLLVTAARGGDEGSEAWAILNDEYTRIPAPGRLGDVVAYRSSETGEVLHLCSHVAADIVFTKNGFGVSAPWCLMRIEDVDLFYLRDDSIERMYFRRRE